MTHTLNHTIHSLNEFKRGDDVWRYVQSFKMSNDIYYGLHPVLLNSYIKLLGINELLNVDWKVNKIIPENDSMIWQAYQRVGFYFFTINSLDNYNPRCDNYGAWENNSQRKEDDIRSTYFYHKSLKNFSKIEYVLMQRIDGYYRGLMLYRRSVDVSALYKTEIFHKNAKVQNTTKPYQRTNYTVMNTLKQQVINNPTEKVAVSFDRLQVIGAKNPKQISNIKYDLTLTRQNDAKFQQYLLERDDILHGFSNSKDQFAIFASLDMIRLLKKTRIWYIDTTFNLSKFYGTFVTFLNNDFENGALQCAYGYIHTVCILFYFYLYFRIERNIHISLYSKS
jgi:hypothetical protein